jgi:tetratricopeptide (TPR) repeat protein
MQNQKTLLTFSAKLFIISCLLLSISSQAQQPDINGLRKKLQTATTPNEKWKALNGLNRYYLKSGKMDSCIFTSQQMLTIAQHLKNDTLIANTYNAIANAFLSKGDFNFALEFYFKALELNKVNAGMLNTNIGGVYSRIGNYDEALKYLRKSQLSYTADSTIIKSRSSKTWTFVYLGYAFNGLHQGDSALYYGQIALEENRKYPDGFVYPGILFNVALAHQQLGDHDLAEAYYKKAIIFSDSTNNPISLSLATTNYSKLLMSQGNYTSAKNIAKQGLEAAVKSNLKAGIVDGAEMLRKVYNHLNKKDSAYYYAEMQFAYKDSIASQQKINEIQNMTFAKQLKDNEEQIKADQAKEEREKNLQYGLIAITLITFLILFFLLSRSIAVNARMIEFLGVLALLIVFEFVNLLLHPFLGKITHHSPVLMLLAMVSIAALLIPAHHYVEKWVTHKLVEKNNAVRLAAAKKTIAKLEGTTVV